MDQNIIGTTKETVFEKQTITVRQLKVWFRDLMKEITLYTILKRMFSLSLGN